MKKQKRHSEIINSVKFNQYINFDSGFRRDLENFCNYNFNNNNIPQALVNLYNNNYNLIDKALINWLCCKLPKKYLIEFWDYINKH